MMTEEELIEFLDSIERHCRYTLVPYFDLVAIGKYLRNLDTVISLRRYHALI